MEMTRVAGADFLFIGAELPLRSFREGYMEENVPEF